LLSFKVSFKKFKKLPGRRPALGQKTVVFYPIVLNLSLREREFLVVALNFP
jgi:hypothetical protein